MALPKTQATRYQGIRFYKDRIKGKVYVGIFSVNNKKYRKILGFENDKFRTTASIAFFKKEQFRNEILSGNISNNKKMNFEKLWSTYINHVKSSQSCSLKTIKTKESNYNAHFKINFDKKYIEKITNFEIQTFANELLKTKKPKTVKNITSDLAAVFEFARKHKYINENPSKNIDLPKFDNQKIFPLSPVESKRIFNTIINFREPLYRGIFTFLLEGRRKDEVLSIEWNMIDLEQKLYTIKYEENKAKKNMFYEMSDELHDILINIDDKKGLVFKSPKTGLKLQNIRHAWSRILKAANINHEITLHEIRHLLGYTLLNECNETEEVTAAVLGQTTTRATRRYAKVRQKVAANGLKKAFDYLKE